MSVSSCLHQATDPGEEQPTGLIVGVLTVLGCDDKKCGECCRCGRRRDCPSRAPLSCPLLWLTSLDQPVAEPLSYQWASGPRWKLFRRVLWNWVQSWLQGWELYICWIFHHQVCWCSVTLLKGESLQVHNDAQVEGYHWDNWFSVVCMHWEEIWCWCSFNKTNVFHIYVASVIIHTFEYTLVVLKSTFELHSKQFACLNWPWSIDYTNPNQSIQRRHDSKVQLFQFTGQLAEVRIRIYYYVKLRVSPTWGKVSRREH